MFGDFTFLKFFRAKLIRNVLTLFGFVQCGQITDEDEVLDGPRYRNVQSEFFFNEPQVTEAGVCCDNIKDGALVFPSLYGMDGINLNVEPLLGTKYLPISHCLIAVRSDNGYLGLDPQLCVKYFLDRMRVATIL